MTVIFVSLVCSGAAFVFGFIFGWEVRGRGNQDPNPTWRVERRQQR